MKWLLTVYLSMWTAAFVWAEDGFVPTVTNQAIHCRSEDVGIARFTSEWNLRAGEKPYADCVYPLGGMVILQRLNGGYLLTNDPQYLVPIPGDHLLPIFLKTDAALSENQSLMGLYAHCVGSYQYQAINGYEKLIFAFKLYSGDLGKLQGKAFLNFDQDPPVPASSFKESGRGRPSPNETDEERDWREQQKYEKIFSSN